MNRNLRMNSVVTFKNQKAVKFLKKPYVKNNFSYYNRWIEVTDDGGVFADDYNPKENYRKLLDEHYAGLKRLNESHILSGIESSCKSKEKSKSKFQVRCDHHKVATYEMITLL